MILFGNQLLKCPNCSSINVHGILYGMPTYKVFLVCSRRNKAGSLLDNGL